MPGLAERARSHPVRWVALFYGFIALVGGVLLSLPYAVAPELRFEEGDYFYKRLLNSLFTSVSAATLTGLTVYDTARDLSRFGQGVVLALMQLGGLGAMILGLRIAYCGLRNGEFRIRQLVLGIVFGTFALETMGALALYSLWPPSVNMTADRLFHSIFHAVSAFCNGGSALWDENLVRFRGAWQLYGVVAPLFIVGGIGMPLLLRGLSRYARPAALTTLLLLSVPPMVLFLTESRAWRSTAQILPSEVRALMQPAMADMPPAERAAAAFFQSASARSAGFHTAALDAQSLSPAGAGVICVLMFIGGAPASTAGGISTVAAVVLLLGIVSAFRRRPVSAIPRDILRSAAVLVAVIGLVIALATGGLAFTERGAPMIEVLFESVSAASASGLSMGLTQRLTVEGRVIVLAAMFAGRVVTTAWAALLVRKCIRAIGGGMALAAVNPVAVRDRSYKPEL